MSTSPESFSSQPDHKPEPAPEEEASPQTEAEPAATMPSSPVPEAALPPEAQGDVNGGPLGCCLGVTVGLFLSLSVAVLSRAFDLQLAALFGSSLSLVTRIVMALVALVAVIILGYAGWRIGKRVYREYELSPRQKKRLEYLERKHSTRQRSRRTR